MTKPLGVIFDMDGVLVDSTEAHYAAWCGLADEIGVTCTREIFESTFGMHNRQIIPLWLEREFPDEELDRLSRRKEEIYREVAETVAERLRGLVAEEAYRIPDHGDPVEVTISLGVATTIDPMETADLLLSRADQALYLAKRGGRNKVVNVGTETASEQRSATAGS